MKLNDIDHNSASELNAKMQSKLGWSMQLDKMSIAEANAMIASIDNKLNGVRRSNRLHESQNDKAYTSMLLARKVLERFITESVVAEKAMSKAQQQAAGAALAAKRGDAPKSGLKGASKGMMDMSTKELEKIAGTKHKGLPKHVDESDFEKSLTKTQRARLNAALIKSDPKNPVNVEKKKREAAKEKSDWYNSFKKPTSEEVSRAGTKHKGLPKHVDESILAEDEVSQAESMMAAKDMVDTIQGMLEDVSRMLNEQLPPLTDNIRANIGASQADAFQTGATSTLTTLLGAVQQARTAMDSSVRSMSGEPAPVSVPAAGDQADLGLDGEEDLAADEFGASDAAAGGELPMGREKRV